jgi:hypothetical protein
MNAQAIDGDWQGKVVAFREFRHEMARAFRWAARPAATRQPISSIAKKSTGAVGAGWLRERRAVYFNTC